MRCTKPSTAASSHTDFEPVVKNEVYETIDSRKLKGCKVPDLYYSELWQMKKVSERKQLPKYVGFCHYRRYFGFMDNCQNTSVSATTAVISALWTTCPTSARLSRRMVP